MQAIILAAGMGRRLGEFTADNTKCMLEVNGVRLIDRMLGQLETLNLDRIVIVTGYEGEKLRNYLNKKYPDRPIVFVDNPIYDKTNNIYSLWLARGYMAEEDTLLLESDLIFDDSILSAAVNAEYPNVALVAKYQTWMDGTMVRIDDENNIVNFIPKKAFKYEDVPFYYKTVNVYKFTKEFCKNHYLPFLEAYIKVLGENEYYEQVLRVITLIDTANIKALPIGNAPWYEIDDVQDLRIAETIFATPEEKLKKLQHSFGGYWRYPGLLDFCYLVNPYFPRKRMIEEMKANFEPLLRDYPSGMGVNSLLAGKYFGIKQKYTVVGNGAAELIKSLMEGHEGKLGVIYPTFEEYPNRHNPESLVIYHPSNEDFLYTADDLMEFFSAKDIKSLLVVNPDNPSGNFIPLSDVLRLSEWTKKKGIRLIIDESFVDFSDGGFDNTLLRNEILEAYPTLCVMKSISKSYGVPGLRLGVLASSDEDLISRMKKDVAIWNINSFAEFYMQIYGKYEKDYAHACEKFRHERDIFLKELQGIPFLRVIPSQANYFLCELTGNMTAHELALKLITEYNILIKDCSSKKGFPEGKQYIRIAIRNREDNRKLIQALRKL
ncbi:MAG: aminotransferase class I/II-fold pyridoxal phosphate-dependent enzyme [Muribaculaceae bacterium]|nr:aminotransferase class I/II-fold pyridoxal phosphate-dependent enzyme [Muribaculaceae bacterium]MDE6523356.1 aminotransferase class I/II-fold pyridoxal phosphate-dependent enzyme [Muribaculaceae bacterium]